MIDFGKMVRSGVESKPDQNQNSNTKSRLDRYTESKGYEQELDNVECVMKTR